MIRDDPCWTPEIIDSSQRIGGVNQELIPQVEVVNARSKETALTARGFNGGRVGEDFR